MVRIVGVDLPGNARVDIALTSLYGIGRSNVKVLLEKVSLDPSTRVKDVTEEEIGRIHSVLDKFFRIEGDLRSEIATNIHRLKEINAYRGIRHSRNLPVRGQRTRVNARTKRGKRRTVGALKKETRAKLGQTQSVKPESGGAKS